MLVASPTSLHEDGSVGDQDEWFEAIEDGVPEDCAFLSSLRKLAPSQLAEHLDAGSTMTYEYSRILMWVYVPFRPIDGETMGIIQMRFGLDDGTLAAYWGGAPLLWDDYHPTKPETLVVKGLRIPGERMAGLATDWLVDQLSRPVDESTWYRAGRMVARRWTLADSGYVIESEGRVPFRAGKRPDRVERVRPSKSRP